MKEATIILKIVDMFSLDFFHLCRSSFMKNMLTSIKDTTIVNCMKKFVLNSKRDSNPIMLAVTTITSEKRKKKHVFK